jgi:predicted NBD/HSP70 family sugar kinase
MRKSSQAQSKDGIRQQNLSALIELVHLRESVSRAELGALLGLSKTTIAELVDELETLGLLIRTGNEQSGSAGRPSQLVAPSSKPQVVVVNPEIDGVNVALINFAHEIFKQEYLPTGVAYSVETTIALVNDYWQRHELSGAKNVLGLCLALPGAIDQATGRLVSAPSLGWNDLDVAARFEAAIGVRVWASNNARAATVSEHLFGAARGASQAVCLFSGVGGIGGGLIINGQVLEGAHGLAGELGKIALVTDSALKVKTFGELMRREDLVRALGASSLQDDELDKMLGESQSAAVHRVVDEQVGYLIAAVRTLRDLHDPQLIVFGGYLGSLVKNRTDEILNLLNHDSLRVRGLDFLVPRVAELKPMVLIGAAEKAWNELIHNPHQYMQLQENKKMGAR